MSIESGPIGQSEEFLESQPPSREKRRGLLKGARFALMMFLASLFPTAARASKLEDMFPVKEAVTALILREAGRKVERAESRRVQAEALRATREANEGFYFPFPDQPRFLIEKPKIECFGYGWYRSRMEDYAKGIVARILQKVFGGSAVASLERVRRETAERQELRENPEVAQQTIPPPATIVRENVEVSPSFVIINDHKSLQTYLNRFGWGRFGRSIGLDFEKLKTVVVGDIVFRDAATQQESTFTAIGASEGVREFDVSAFLGIRGARYRARNTNEENWLRAIASFANNAEIVLNEVTRQEVPEFEE